MPPPPSTLSLSELRAQLAQKFPQAHKSPAPREPAISLKTAHFPVGGITELVSGAPSCGSALVISDLMATDNAPSRPFTTEKLPFVLIDGRNSFDPASYPIDTHQRVLWARCKNAAESIKAADLFLKDGNLPIVLIDLSLNDQGEVSRISPSSWHRLRAATEATATTLIALTPVPSIPSPSLRLELRTAFDLTSLHLPLEELSLSSTTAAQRRQHIS